MKAMSRDKFLILAGLATMTLAALAGFAGAQRPDSARMAGMAEHAMSGSMDENTMKHMELTPIRAATAADSARAKKLVTELKHSIAKYQDTTAAVADGYRMFLPNVKEQHV